MEYIRQSRVGFRSFGTRPGMDRYDTSWRGLPVVVLLFFTQTGLPVLSASVSFKIQDGGVSSRSLWNLLHNSHIFRCYLRRLLHRPPCCHPNYLRQVVSIKNSSFLPKKSNFFNRSKTKLRGVFTFDS